MKKVLFLVVAFAGLAFVSANAQTVRKADVNTESRQVNANLTQTVPAVEAPATNNADTKTPASTMTTGATKRTAVINDANRVNLNPNAVPTTTQPVKAVDPKK